MDISLGDIHQFVVLHKWWIAALIPFVLAVLALKMRG